MTWPLWIQLSQLLSEAVGLFLPRILCEAHAVSFTMYVVEQELTHSNTKLGMQQAVFNCIALCLLYHPVCEASGMETSFWQMVLVKY